MILFVACWVVAIPASAGMVKYRTPDGKEGYASPDRIPAGAVVEVKNYQPDGSLTRDESKKLRRTATPTSKAKATATPIAPRQEAALEAGPTEEARRAALAEDRWRRKAKTAKDKLAKAERDHERWRVRCFGDDDDRNSRDDTQAECSNYERGQLDAATATLKEAQEWADDGLYDACRRDERCLPGHIR